MGHFICRSVPNNAKFGCLGTPQHLKPVDAWFLVARLSQTIGLELLAWYSATWSSLHQLSYPLMLDLACICESSLTCLLLVTFSGLARHDVTYKTALQYCILEILIALLLTPCKIIAKPSRLSWAETDKSDRFP